jgi:hypothetical protein
MPLLHKKEEIRQPAGQQLVKVRAQVVVLQAAEEQHPVNRSLTLTTTSNREAHCVFTLLIFCSMCI